MILVKSPLKLSIQENLQSGTTSATLLTLVRRKETHKRNKGLDKEVNCYSFPPFLGLNPPSPNKKCPRLGGKRLETEKLIW